MASVTRAKRSQDFVKIAKQAEAMAVSFRVLPKVLAELMEELHGQKFRVVVNHEQEFILIRPV